MAGHSVVRYGLCSRRRASYGSVFFFAKLDGAAMSLLALYAVSSIALLYPDRRLCESTVSGARTWRPSGRYFLTRIYPADIGSLQVAGRSIAVRPLNKDTFRRHTVLPDLRRRRAASRTAQFRRIFRTAHPQGLYGLTNRAINRLSRLYDCRNYRFLHYYTERRTRLQKGGAARLRYETPLFN